MRRLAIVLSLACAPALAAGDAALAQCAAVDNPSARLACYDAVAGRPASPPAALPAPAPTPSAEAFGKPAPREELSSITARIVGPLKQWERGTLIRLDNGQVWKVTDDGSAYYPANPDNAEVELGRGFLGGYWLEIKPVSRKVRVKRVS